MFLAVKINVLIFYENSVEESLAKIGSVQKNTV